MPKFLTLRDACQALPKLSESLQDEPTIITAEGEPVMVVLSHQHFESVMETLEILSDAAFMEDLRESMAQAERGETLSLEEVKARLERHA